MIYGIPPGNNGGKVFCGCVLTQSLNITNARFKLSGV